MDVVDFGKMTLMAVVTWFVAVFTNYQDAFMTLFVGFILDIIMGLGADVNINKRRFSLKKAGEALQLLIFYFVLIIFVHIAMSNQYAEMSKGIITWLTYIVGYFYLTNIFRNAKLLFPNSKSVRFIYSFLSTEVLYKLKDYLGFRDPEGKKARKQKEFEGEESDGGNDL